MIKPAELLYKALNGRCLIETPNLNEFFRLSGDKTQKYILSNSKDIFSSNKDEFIFDVSPQDAFRGLAQTIETFDKIVRFNLMIIPPKPYTAYVRLDIFNNVIIRVLEYYEIRIDEMIIRYDVLVEKAITNAN